MPRRLERILAPAEEILSEGVVDTHLWNGGLRDCWPGDRNDVDEFKAAREHIDALGGAAQQLAAMVDQLRAGFARVEQTEEA